MKQIKKNKIFILGIDTSCDETSAAITCNTNVLSNIISSQVELHTKFGGVVPMIAKREHQARIEPVINEAFTRATKNYRRKITWKDIDAIAVTYGPGLAIALEVGLAKARELAKNYNKKFIAVNHMEGHLWSGIAKNSKGHGGVEVEKIKFPSLGVLISGGHTELVKVEGFGKYKIIGETLDDAIGEAYDKVARMIGLGYPGGAVLTEMAKLGNPFEYKFSVPMEKSGNMNMSYSGLKTAIYYLVKEKTKINPLTKKEILDISASFERVAIKELCLKIEIALQQQKYFNVFVGGGVTCSVKVRREIRKTCRKFGVKTYFPDIKHINMDNGAMIAIVGYLKALRNEYSDINIDRDPRADISSTN